MQKNKFNIGQKVIVIDGRTIVEKEVIEIDGKGNEVSYTLSNTTNAPKVRSSHFIDMFSDPFFVESHHRIMQRPLFKRPDYIMADDIDKNNNKYMESEIFESENDFRANVIITRPKPTQKELKEKLQEYADSLATKGNPEVKSLLEKINL